jgi:glutamate--cysteine ligase
MMSQHLKTKIANQVFEHCKIIDQWFEEKFKAIQPPFYSSVDIRDSGEKVAPVDCNLYPGGFNNICDVDFEHASTLIQRQIQKISKQEGRAIPKKVVIIPEAHTENRYYLENVAALSTLLKECDLDVRIAWYPETVTQSFQLKSITEKTIDLHPFEIQQGNLILKDQAAGFTPDWIIINHDFSGGYPERLRALRTAPLTSKQLILPPFELGWFDRKKSSHFKYYNQLAHEFANLIQIDPWHITIDSEPVGPVQFNEGLGIEPLIQTVDRMLSKLKTDHERHGIDRAPALFIKNDAGTYGIGIMVIQSSDDIRKMNRREKNKMSIGKNKSEIHQVLVQEGVPTRMTTDGATSEPVIYLVGSDLVGGFIRANTERSDLDNLNSAGMIFKKLCFKDLHDHWGNSHTPCTAENYNDLPILEAVYGVVAKLSALAAGLEIQALKTKKAF